MSLDLPSEFDSSLDRNDNLPGDEPRLSVDSILERLIVNWNILTPDQKAEKAYRIYNSVVESRQVDTADLYVFNQSIESRLEIAASIYGSAAQEIRDLLFEIHRNNQFKDIV